MGWASHADVHGRHFHRSRRRVDRRLRRRLGASVARVSRNAGGVPYPSRVPVSRPRVACGVLGAPRRRYRAPSFAAPIAVGEILGVLRELAACRPRAGEDGPVAMGRGGAPRALVAGGVAASPLLSRRAPAARVRDWQAQRCAHEFTFERSAAVVAIALDPI